MPEGVYNPARTQYVTAADFRKLTGFSSTRDIGDGDLNEVLVRAQAFVLHDLSTQLHRVPLEGARDGVNTKFTLPEPEVRGGVVMDDTLNGTTDGGDVLVMVRDDTTTPPTWAAAVVSAVDALHGVFTLSAAPASTSAAVEFTGRVLYARLDKTQLAGLVTLYAAHLVELRARDRVLLTRPEGMKANTPSRTAGPGWLDLYMREKRKVGPGPMVVGGITPLPRMAGEAEDV